MSFLVPSINTDTAEYCIDYDTIHNLASVVATLHIPSRGVASDWEHIAQQWADMNVQVERLGFEELADSIKEGCKSVNALPLERRPIFMAS